MARNSQWRTITARVLASRRTGVPELLAALHEVNPTARDLPDAERDERYLLKAQLQTRLIEEHPTDLELRRDGVSWVLGVRGGRDAKHVTPEQLGERARAWFDDHVADLDVEDGDTVSPRRRTRASSKPPEDPIEAHIELGDYEGAVTLLRRAADHDGARAAQLLEILLEYLDRPADTLRAFERLPSTIRARPEVGVFAALALVRSGDVDAAESFARGIEGAAVSAWEAIGAARVALRDVDGMRRAAARLDAAGAPGRAAADMLKRHALDVLRSGLDAELAEMEEARSDGDLDRAERLARSILERDPSHRDARGVVAEASEGRVAARAEQLWAEGEQLARANRWKDAARVWRDAAEAGHRRAGPRAEEAQRRAEEDDARRRIDQARASLTDDPDEGLRRYLDLSEAERSRIRADAPSAVLDWLEALAGVRDPAARISAAFALVRASEARASGRPDEVSHLLEPHLAAVERSRAARELLGAARDAVLRRRKDAALAALDSGEAELRAGNAAEADRRLAEVRPKLLDDQGRSRLAAVRSQLRELRGERQRIDVWSATLASNPVTALALVADVERGDGAWAERRRQTQEAARTILRVQDLIVDGPLADVRAPRSRIRPHVTLDVDRGMGWVVEATSGWVLLEEVPLPGTGGPRRGFAFASERLATTDRLHVVNRREAWLSGSRQVWRLDLEAGSVDSCFDGDALHPQVLPAVSGTWRSTTFRKWWFEQDGVRGAAIAGVVDIEVVPGTDDAVIVRDGGLDRIGPSGARQPLPVPWTSGDTLLAVTAHPTDALGLVLSLHRKSRGELEVSALTADGPARLATRTTADPWGVVACCATDLALVFLLEEASSGYTLSALDLGGERWRVDVAARCGLITDHQARCCALAIEGAEGLSLVALGRSPPILPALGAAPDLERYSEDCHVALEADDDPLREELEWGDDHLEARFDTILARRPGDPEHARRAFAALVSAWPERGLALLEARGIAREPAMELTVADDLHFRGDWPGALQILEAMDLRTLPPGTLRHALHLSGMAHLALGRRDRAREALEAAAAEPAPTRGECTLERTIAWLDLLDATDPGRAGPEPWTGIRRKLSRARESVDPVAARRELDVPEVATCRLFDVEAERARAVLADPTVPFWPRLRALARVGEETFWDPPLPRDPVEQHETCTRAGAWLGGPATAAPPRRAWLALAEERDELVVRLSLEYDDPPDRLVHRDPAWAEREVERFTSALGAPELRLQGEEVFRFLEERLPELATRWEVLAEARLTRVVKASVTVPNGDQAAIDVMSEAGPIDADAALAAWLQGRHYVRIDDRTVARLPEAWMSRFAVEAYDTRAAVRAGDAPPAGVLLAERWGATETWTLPPLPAGLRATLRPYQLEGFHWLARRRDAGIGACLADEMGLGKTVQALTLLLDGAVRGEPGPFLIVAPASLLAGWRQEMDRFTPELARRRVVHHGPDRSTAPYGGYVVVLTTYEMLRADSELLCATRWAAVVFDEAQRLKNPSSRTANAARTLTASFRLAITGTPLENRVEDLAGMLGIVVPGLLGERTLVRLRQGAVGPAEFAARVGRRVGPVLLRRRKADVAKDLPPVHEVEVPVDLFPSEAELYQRLSASVRLAVEEALARGEPPSVALTSVTRLRQAACDPALLGIADTVGTTSSKIATLASLLSSATDSGHRALVFSSFRKLLDRAAVALEDLGIRHLRLDGETPLRERERVAREMAAPEGAAVCLLTYGAGGVGLNLVGADHVILLDPWWNPAVEGQAIDRAHRIGQTRPVLVHRLVAVGTIEEQVRALQEDKRTLFHEAMAGARAAQELLLLLDT